MGYVDSYSAYVAWVTLSATYIGRLSLEHVQDRFKDNAVDGQMLLDVTEDELRSELGLTMLQARKVIARLPK